MKRLFALPVLLMLGLGLAACGEEAPPGPPTSKIFIDNQSSTEANVRIKFWTKDYKKVSSDSAETIEFVNEQGANVVQVHAKSRKQWDECWVTLNVGQTLVVYDGIERIACRIE
ncbi:MAG: hypothetical protein HQ481_11105 [Alphaproteobacteria bacterium]|nr:hypothetical protein [Alphaproteobacteria bacterium]